MLYLFVVLKIPIIAAIWLVWWAVKQEPTPPRTSATTAAPSGARTRSRACRAPRGAVRMAATPRSRHRACAACTPAVASCRAN